MTAHPPPLSACERAQRFLPRFETHLPQNEGDYTTGQLHKGDTGHGRFLQITAEAPHEGTIPTEAGALPTDLSFGTLQAAQALGDRQALREAGRPIVRFHLGTQVVEWLRQFNQALV